MYPQLRFFNRDKGRRFRIQQYRQQAKITNTAIRQSTSPDYVFTFFEIQLDSWAYDFEVKAGNPVVDIRDFLDEVSFDAWILTDSAKKHPSV